jgi:hypothetical protein
MLSKSANSSFQQHVSLEHSMIAATPIDWSAEPQMGHVVISPRLILEANVSLVQEHGASPTRPWPRHRLH